MAAIRANLSIHTSTLCGVRCAFRAVAAAVAAISLCRAGVAHAQSATTWTGGGGDTNWGTTGN